MKIRLPAGGTLVAQVDLAQDPPSDCSLAFNLLSQVSVYLASTQCLIKVLQLAGPLVTVVKALDPSPKLAVAVPNFLKVAESLVPCTQAGTGVGEMTFVKDLLCLAVQTLNCVIEKLKASPGNAESLVPAIESIQGMLQLAGPVFELAGIPPIQLTVTGEPAQFLGTLQSSAASLQIAADALGGCES